MATLLERRRTMAKRGSSIDWESIAKGMCDFTTEFSIPAEVGLSCAISSGLSYRMVTAAVAVTGNLVAQNFCSGCTKLESITLPSTIASIGNQAFRTCSSLEEIIIEATTPPTLGTNVFQSASKSFIIYVPDGSVSTYKADTGWSTYSSRIKGISERP